MTCINHGGYVQEFRVRWFFEGQEGASKWSRKYPNPQSFTFDLTGLDIPEGAEVWPEVHAILGKTKQSWEHVIYSPQSNDGALYRTTGTIWSVTIRLEN